MKYIDIIVIDHEDYSRAVALLEEAGIEVSLPVARKAYYIDE